MAVKKAAKNGEKKKGVAVIIVMAVILVLILFVAFAVFVIGFNAFGLRDDHMADFLRGIPVVNRLLPPEEEDYYDENGYIDELLEYGFDEEIFYDWEADEFIELIRSLVGEIGDLRQAVDEADELAGQLGVVIGERNATNAELRQRIDELEEAHAEVRSREEDFDRRVAMGDPRAFQDFFERINPDHAVLLYLEAARYNAENDLVRVYIARVNSMDESDAAAILEEMMELEINLVARILEGLSSTRSGNILTEFDPANAARMMVIMAPDSIIQGLG